MVLFIVRASRLSRAFRRRLAPAELRRSQPAPDREEFQPGPAASPPTRGASASYMKRSRRNFISTYWLQYGLALRNFGNQAEALEKLKTAREAYSSHQIEHAYAQQLMIIASMSPNWDEAEALLNEAIDALRVLIRVEGEADSYPIAAR